MSFPLPEAQRGQDSPEPAPGPVDSRHALHACAACGLAFLPKREHGRFCSAKCRSAARPGRPRARVRTGANASSVPGPSSDPAACSRTPQE